jgi:hypothetical protein
MLLTGMRRVKNPQPLINHEEIALPLLAILTVETQEKKITTYHSARALLVIVLIMAGDPPPKHSPKKSKY